MRKYSETREAIESFARATHVSITSATCGEELLAMRDECDAAEPRSGEGYRRYDCRLGEGVPPRFVVERDGQLVNWHGDVTRWTVEDLVASGSESEE